MKAKSVSPAFWKFYLVNIPQLILLRAVFIGSQSAVRVLGIVIEFYHNPNFNFATSFNSYFHASTIYPAYYSSMSAEKYFYSRWRLQRWGMMSQRNGIGFKEHADRAINSFFLVSLIMA